MLTDIYKGKKVFITGNTGFKGTWLKEWLQLLGADVYGYALEPNTKPSHFNILGNPPKGNFADVRDGERLLYSLKEASPDIVFHLSAQPLVRESYENPVTTFETNMMGTVNLLEACREIDSIKAIVIITTDKVYKDQNRTTGYREEDILGGYDPYSASKVCVEHIVDSYRNSFFKEKGVLVATARAGNIIGGGDWSADRIVPDLMRAYENKTSLTIRMPNAVRPFQHVLDGLYGYLLLGQGLLQGREELADAFNFGAEQNKATVSELLGWASLYWSELRKVQIILQGSDFHETNTLMLNSDKAWMKLAWKPLYSAEKAVAETVEWYNCFYNMKWIATKTQIENYMKVRNEQGY